MKIFQPIRLALLAACAWLAFQPAGADPLPPLIANGHGIRRILIFDVYEMTLRTTKPMRHAAEILADSAPQEILLHILRDAPADRFIDAIAHGVSENRGDTPEAQPLLEQFYAALRTAGGARQGSVARIVWDGQATSILLDGRPLVSARGPALRNALLVVWLGEKPVDAQLKRGLLGES